MGIEGIFRRLVNNNEANLHDRRLETANGGPKEVYFPGWSRPKLLQERHLLIIGLHETMPHGESDTVVQVHSTVLRTGNRKLSALSVKWFQLFESLSREYNRYQRMFTLSAELLEYRLWEWKIYKKVRGTCLCFPSSWSVNLTTNFQLQPDFIK